MPDLHWPTLKKFTSSLVWFRRDLRIADHAALYEALRQSDHVYCAFIFDTDILQALRAEGVSADRRVDFILDSVVELDAALREFEGGLIVRHAAAVTDIATLAAELNVDAVFANRDYEPQAVARDSQVARALQAQGRAFVAGKDQVIFERDEVLTQAGTPFSVFTPYKNAWLARLAEADGDFWLKPYPVNKYVGGLEAPPEKYHGVIPSLEQLGFDQSNLAELRLPTGSSGAHELLDDFLERIGDYGDARDFPSVKGPSYLSVHLRFGTISIRTLARAARERLHSGTGARGAAVWLSELIWRDFYFMILHHHPRVVGHAFKPAYDAIEWEQGAHADALFAAWCDGRTGYPLVDAAMLQLNQSGYMHNRLRMVTASFLMKDLGIDWRRGEAYFARLLNDYDLSANNGGWQWAASTGCDAQPYFRIFNPVTQSERFDADGKFIRLYLPQLARLSSKRIHAPWLATAQELREAGLTLIDTIARDPGDAAATPAADADLFKTASGAGDPAGATYPLPIVQHDMARKRTLQRYAVVKPTVAASEDRDAQTDE